MSLSNAQWSMLVLLICGFVMHCLREKRLGAASVERFLVLDYLTFEGRYKITILRDFLSSEECAIVIRAATPMLARSKIMTAAQTGEERTSHSCFLYKQDVQHQAARVLQKISDRASALSSYPESHQEPLQVVRYLPGQLYKPHFDVCVPSDSSICLDDVRDHGGMRHSTLLIYLNDVEEGGETEFPELNKTFTPAIGSAIFFTNLMPNSDTIYDPLSRHGARSVQRGVKWVCNQWIRAHPYK